MEKDELQIPISEKLKNIPGVFGINLTEKPKHKVLRSDGDFELREYEPLLIAKTTTFGEYEKAREDGFKKLAGYIFGKNKGEHTLAMTAPVIEEKGEVMAMTAPVFQEMGYTLGEKSLTMSFIFPSEITALTAPTPNDSTIQIQEVPAQTWAVIKYTGTNTANDIEKKTRELENWMASIGHKAEFESRRIAQYDGPMTLPFLRKNEVQFRIWSKEIQ